MAERVYGLVLASGLSRRFGTANKLTATLEGRSIIARSISAYTEALASAIVVVPADDREVKVELKTLAVQVVLNHAYRQGQSASLRAGVLALPADAEAAVIGVADQPLLRPQTISALVEAWTTRGSPAVAPTYRGYRGNPVLFSRQLFSELSQAKGDVGGREVLLRHDTYLLEIPEWWSGLDVDTPADLERASAILQNLPATRKANPRNDVGTWSETTVKG